MSGPIKRVYNGLPNHLQDRVFWVEEQHRVHDLSFSPGGSDVIVEYVDNRVLGYDRVKYPSKYIRKLLGDDLRSINHNFWLLSGADQLEIMRSLVANIFAKKWNGDGPKFSIFELAWGSASSDKLPWITLEGFDFSRDDIDDFD